MNKTKIAAVALVTILGFGGFGSATANGTLPAVLPGQTLASYMNDDQDAQWEKLQHWVESEYGQGATVPTEEPTTEPSPEPTPTEEPTQEPATGIESGEVTWTQTGVTFTGKIAGTAPGDRVQIRTDTAELTGQRGFYEYEFVKTDGTVSFVLDDYTAPQDTLFWHIAKGGGEFAYGDVVATGSVSKPATTEPAPEPTTEPSPEPSAPSSEGLTGGSGGALTDRTFQSFSSNGLTSRYHVYAGGLDWSKPVGLLVYGDGSGGHGFDNPTQSYLLGGSSGLVNVAKKHNLLLVVPEAPAPNCDGYDNCWYDSTAPAKAKWSSDLVTKIKGQYNLDNSRVVTGGYSSGSQWHRWFLPTYGEAQSVDLAVMVTYGGAPAVTANYSEAYKDDLVLSWDNGTADESHVTSSWGAIGGYNWYTNAGFTTDKLWTSGVGHARGGEFGGILDREITQHLK